MVSCVFFFFNDTATTEIYTLSLHDALPIYLIVYGKDTHVYFVHVYVHQCGNSHTIPCLYKYAFISLTPWSASAWFLWFSCELFILFYFIEYCIWDYFLYFCENTIPTIVCLDLRIVFLCLNFHDWCWGILLMFICYLIYFFCCFDIFNVHHIIYKQCMTIIFSMNGMFHLFLEWIVIITWECWGELKRQQEGTEKNSTGHVNLVHSQS